MLLVELLADGHSQSFPVTSIALLQLSNWKVCNVRLVQMALDSVIDIHCWLLLCSALAGGGVVCSTDCWILHDCGGLMWPGSIMCWKRKVGLGRAPRCCPLVLASCVGPNGHYYWAPPVSTSNGPVAVLSVRVYRGPRGAWQELAGRHFLPVLTLSLYSPFQHWQVACPTPAGCNICLSARPGKGSRGRTGRDILGRTAVTCKSAALLQQEAISGML